MQSQPRPSTDAQGGTDVLVSQLTFGPLRAHTEPSLIAEARLWAQTREGLARFSEDLDVGSLAALSRESGPLPPGSAPGRAASVLDAVLAELGERTLPEVGMGEQQALVRLAGILGRHGLDLSHPAAVAHLQPPTLALAAAADSLASIVNASVDTFDSGPSSVAIEQWVISVLLDLAGLSSNSDGVLTPGGSISNLLGLLLARDDAARRRGLDVRHRGLAGLDRPVVLVSEVAHFSIDRACATLGLGEDAVMPVPVDRCRRMDPRALEARLRELDDDQVPVAIVATAGTTDFGSIDPLTPLAAIAQQHGIWFHVDAAYGFGALFSKRLAPRLDGLQFADSITLDLHKLGWQPAATSCLLVSKTHAFASTDRNAEYLNPIDEALDGYTGLLGMSLQTTRRADAIKVAATFLGFGRKRLGDMVDACHELARHAQALVLDHPELELVCAAELTTVVFRYRPRVEADAQDDPGVLDRINAGIRRRLLDTGEALVGRTKVDVPGEHPRVCLKFTLLNPRTSPRDIEALLSRIVDVGRMESQA